MLTTHRPARSCSRSLLLALVLSLCAAAVAAAPAAPFRCDTLAVDRRGVLTVEATLAGVPALLRIPPHVTAPPIILWHGFGPPASEQALLQVLPLDAVPAIKVYLGLPLFGQRAPAGGSAELARRQAEDFAGLLFAPTVLGAADELPAVLDDLKARGCTRQGDAIGLFGFSAGGAAVLVALAERKVAVDAAVIVNASTGLKASVRALERATGTAFAWTPAARVVARRSDALLRHAAIASGDPPPALLIVHGADDTVLGPQVARDLFAALLPDYRRQSGVVRLKLDVLPAITHSWTEAAPAVRINAATAAWLNRHRQPSAE